MCSRWTVQARSHLAAALGMSAEEETKEPLRELGKEAQTALPMASWRRAVERLRTGQTVRTRFEGLCLLWTLLPVLSLNSRTHSPTHRSDRDLLPIPTALVRAHLVHLLADPHDSGSPQRGGRRHSSEPSHSFFCALDSRPICLH